MAGFSQFQQDNKRFAGWPVRCIYAGQEAVMKKILTIAMVSGLSFAIVMPAQEDPGVREATRFERSKDAAAAREARIEGRGTSVANARDNATSPRYSHR